MQGGIGSDFCNTLLAYNQIKKNARVYSYRSLNGKGLPGESLADGLRHAMATLCDALNFAYCMGYKRIIMVGVDLYDNRYFYLPPDKTKTYEPSAKGYVAADVNAHGLKTKETHNTVNLGLINLMKQWKNEAFDPRGVEVYVLNPKSLLTEVFPVFGAEIYEDKVNTTHSGQ
jgi:hypothetical protein